jgi:hypothetical protein
MQDQRLWDSELVAHAELDSARFWPDSNPPARPWSPTIARVFVTAHMLKGETILRV